MSRINSSSEGIGRLKKLV
ncbi:hypothetical protein CJF30_00004758 [Rutstroemia sp. NJR-2017a BBW]|nr:hypothetical protein CJF30_00004758 [Rutstroemia sp. NJR-2017a BBW]